MELTLKTAIAIALKITITLLMVSMGLRMTHRSMILLWRNPRLLAGSIAAAFLIVPLATYLVLQILPLSFSAKAGLWVIAITPGAPMIYNAASRRSIANAELAASFQVTVALLVIVFAPLWLTIIGALSGAEYGIPPLVIAKQVFTIQLIPILLGLVIHLWQPAFAESAANIIIKIGGIVLVVLVVAILIVIGPKVIAAANSWRVTGAVLVAVAAIAGGHYLTGPEPATRLTIADANVQRNPGLALAIAAWNLPDQKPAMVVVILIYVIVATLAAAIYTKIYGKHLGIEYE